MDLLDSLIVIHQANNRLTAINELKGDLPKLLNKQETELDTINSNQNEIKERLKDLDSTLVANQSSLNNNSDQLNKYNDQLFKVTNNKEYEALLLETDHLKSAISNLNNELSNLNIEKQELEELTKSNKDAIKTLSNSIADNTKMLSEQMSETVKEEQLLIKNKDNTIETLGENNYLNRYNKLFSKYGKGMASVVRNSCNNCYSQLPSQLIVEIQYDKKIITCPACSVFLYYKNEED